MKKENSAEIGKKEGSQSNAIKHEKASFTKRDISNKIKFQSYLILILRKVLAEAQPCAFSL